MAERRYFTGAENGGIFIELLPIPNRYRLSFDVTSVKPLADLVVEAIVSLQEVCQVDYTYHARALDEVETDLEVCGDEPDYSFPNEPIYVKLPLVIRGWLLLGLSVGSVCCIIAGAYLWAKLI